MFNTDLNGLTKWKEKDGKKRMGNVEYRLERTHKMEGKRGKEEKGECLIHT